MRGIQTKLQNSRTIWRRMKEMGWDDQMRDFRAIDKVHVLARDE